MMETEQMQDAAAMEQMAFAPQGFTEQEGDLNLDEFEIVSPQFFAQIKEPAFTVNVNRITVNSACVRMMMDVDFVEILISRKEKKLVLRPCSEMDISGYKWARTKDGKRYASQRTGEPFVLSLCQIMGWNPDYRYKILGKMDRSRGKEIMVFDLMAAQCFPKPAPGENGKPARRSAIPVGWNGKFGPTVGENLRKLHVDTFDGYTVFSIKGDKKKKDGKDAGPKSGETADTESRNMSLPLLPGEAQDDGTLTGSPDGQLAIDAAGQGSEEQ